jgi:hypothetical protein
MKTTIKLAAAALFGAGMLALSAGSASAAVACNGAGECWHVRGHYTYPPEAGIVIHPEGWKWGPTEHFAWRDHAGRGYWRNGIWVKF